MRKIRATPGAHSAPSFACIAALALGWWVGAAGAANEQPSAQRALIEIGRRIYEDGILPDGKPLRGVHPDGFVLQGAQAACATCHRHSGYGSFEGSVMVAPIAGAVLFEPAPYFIMAGPTPTGADATVPWYRAMSRPAYDEATLARAVREGLDPDGDQLMPPMPRFALNDQAFSALLAYLRQLSASPSPGIESGTLHLATVIAPDAPQGAAEAVVGVLQAWAARQPSEMRWDLHVWRLSGAPQGWEAQLEEDYRQRPMFALLSGAGGAEWSPVHRFCERVKVACVLPSVEVAPESAQQDLYSIYFSPGVTLEAELLARHLQSVGVASKDTHPIRRYRKLRFLNPKLLKYKVSMSVSDNV
jgi:hypothetical protein